MCSGWVYFGPVDSTSITCVSINSGVSRVIILTSCQALLVAGSVCCRCRCIERDSIDSSCSFLLCVSVSLPFFVFCQLPYFFQSEGICCCGIAAALENTVLVSVVCVSVALMIHLSALCE